MCLSSGFGEIDLSIQSFKHYHQKILAILDLITCHFGYLDGTFLVNPRAYKTTWRQIYKSLKVKDFCDCSTARLQIHAARPPLGVLELHRKE